MSDEILRQKIEELDGSRNRGSRARAAVRRADLAALLALDPFTLAATTEEAVPVADYNALLALVKAMHAALVRIAMQVKP
jgi:hypothetical protein